MRKRSIIVFFIALFLFGGTYFIVEELYDLKNKSIVEINGEELGKGNKINHKVEKSIFFLLVGVDQNVDVTGNATEDVDHVRTDTMILVNVDFETGDIGVVSIPRDTKVNYNGNYIKINAAHAYDGIKGSLKAVRKLTGLDVDYYMSVDYDAVSRIVDAIGGVEIDSPIEMDVPDIDVFIPKGVSVLNGKQALYFVRAREILETGSDIERMDNQQYFLKQLIKTMLKPSNILKIPDILTVYKDNVKTNISLSSFGNIGLNAYKFKNLEMVSKTLPGYADMETGYNGQRISYFYADEEAMRELFLKLFPNYLIDKDYDELKESNVVNIND